VQIFMLLIGLAILYYWNSNRMQGIELASSVYQSYGPVILVIGLGFCGGAAFF
jgi:hypothetical protein